MKKNHTDELILMVSRSVQALLDAVNEYESKVEIGPEIWLSAMMVFEKVCVAKLQLQMEMDGLSDEEVCEIIKKAWDLGETVCDSTILAVDPSRLSELRTKRNIPKEEIN